MDVYSYDNLTNTTLSIGGYTILPYGEYVSNGSTIAALDAENGGRVQKYLNGVLVPVTSGSNGIPATWTDATRTALVGAANVPVPVSGAGIADASGLTLTTAHANTTRLPAGTQTYNINGSTGWSVGDGIAVFLPASGTVSFAVSGGPTLNGATSTLTRTLAGNSIGYVVLNRIAGSSAYSLSGV